MGQDEAGPSTKRKKKSVENVKLQVLEAGDGIQAPILAYFPTPYDPCGKDDSTELYASTKTSHTQVVVRTDRNVDFVGHNAQGESSTWNPTVYALGVFDREAGTLKIVPATSNKIFRMEPRVHGVTYGMDLGNENRNEPDREARLANKISLVDKFGTKKSKNKLEKARRGLVKETALGASDEQFKGFMQDALKQEGLLMTKKEVLESANAAMVRKIPPHNLNAGKPEDAYPLDKIISQEEWQAMDSDVVELGKASRKPELVEELRNGFKYWEFILDRLHRIRVEGDREGNAKRVRILVYLNHLLSLFHSTKGRVITGRNPYIDERVPLEIPPVIYEKIKGLFIQELPAAGAERGGKVLFRDYLLSYILVLAHKVDGFKSDAAEIGKKLKLTVADLGTHYAQIGCKIDSSSKATLPMPLTLQGIDDDGPSKGGGRGKRGRGR